MSPPRAPGSVPVIELRDIVKTYAIGEIQVHALRGVSLDGRSRRLRRDHGRVGVGQVDDDEHHRLPRRADRGWYWLDGVDVRKLDETSLSQVRSRKIGFVFQSFNLIARTSALANVELPLSYMGVKSRERRERALQALEAVGLADRARHVPSELSGGQQQRVAVARALVTNPALILADEPTGNLDSVASGDVMDIFCAVHRTGRTVVVITHEEEVAARAHRVIRLRDGQIVSDSTNDRTAAPTAAASAT